MKKLILAIIAVGAISSAQAQAQKAGSWLLYGTAGFSSGKTTENTGTPGSTDVESKQNSWNLSPGLGYQFNDNWTVGLELGIGGGKSEPGGSTSVTKMSNFHVGPFVRYHWVLSNTFFLYDQLNVDYMSGKTKIETPGGVADVESTDKGFGIRMTPAVGINVTKCLALNFGIGGIGYSSVKTDFPGSGEEKNSGFNISFGQQVNIGISAYFGGRHKRATMEPGIEHRHMDSSDDE
jgi:opacity protein-like surface antigen